MNTDKKKQAEIKKVIKSLSENNALESNADVIRYLDTFRDIYIKEDKVVYRHMYSDLFTTLIDLKRKDNDIDAIGDKLYFIYNECDFNDPLKQPLKKLVDHTNLEIARINYVSNIDYRLDMRGNDLQEKYEKTYELAKEMEPKVETIFNKTNTIYSEFISILGIFSAIVLVYFGGTSILGNILSTMKDTFILKSILMSIVVGILVFNTIFMFFYFLSKLTKQSISRTNDETYHTRSFLERLKIRYPVVFYLNFFLAISLMADLIAWVIYLINKKIDLYQLMILSYQNISNEYLLVFWLLMFLSLINFIFLVYYIYGKLFDKQMGHMIKLSYIEPIKMRKENKEWLITGRFGEVIKCEKWYKAYCKKYLMKIKNAASISLNIKRRLFNRYPIFAFLNVAIILMILFYIKFFI